MNARSYSETCSRSWSAARPVLSVAIPFHREDPSPLIEALKPQLGSGAEIVLFGDGPASRAAAQGLLRRVPGMDAPVASAPYRQDMTETPQLPALSSERVLVIGAGRAGTMVAREMLRHPESGLNPIGYLDDDKQKQGQMLVGIPVLGKLDDLSIDRGEGRHHPPNE
jgi:hypothetical protein